MPNLLRSLAVSRLGCCSSLPVIVFATIVATLYIISGGLFAQQAPLHLNPAIEKLAHGQPMIGIQTDDMSLQNCHSLARLDFDYAYVDMEHGPLNLDGLAYCVAAMVDKAAVLKKGNAQPKVALLARFPPYGRDLESNDWIVKQALDMGLMGVIFNSVDNKEQMMRLVRYMRYPQQKGERMAYTELPEAVQYFIRLPANLRAVSIASLKPTGTRYRRVSLALEKEPNSTSRRVVQCPSIRRMSNKT
jgi:hypothetical protein